MSLKLVADCIAASPDIVAELHTDLEGTLEKNDIFLGEEDIFVLDKFLEGRKSPEKLLLVEEISPLAEPWMII